MGKRRHTAEQVIGKLREAEVVQSKGMSMEEVLRQLGISDATYYKWRKEYGGLRVDQAKRRRAAEEIQEELAVSERRVCRVLGQARSTQRRDRVIRCDEEALRQQVVALACDYGRYGYRRITALLRNDG